MNSLSRIKSFSSPLMSKNHHETSTIKHELLLKIPGCIVHMMEEGETIELARGDFSIYVLKDQDLSLATIIKVGKHLKWPLTKDEPVVKLDALHYLFTLPMRGGDPLNYGVTFPNNCDKNYLLYSLDAFLRDHSCFSCPNNNGRNDLDWKEFAPNIEAYNGLLARAIAEGTGHIVRGIFMCSNAYFNKVQNGGESILSQPQNNNNYNNNNGRISSIERTKTNKKNTEAKNNSINQSMKRARTLSDMTEKMSKAMLNGIGVTTGSVMGPLVNSKQGKAILSSMPGEVLLASLDAIDKIMNAAEAAEKQALNATSGATVRMVSNRYGEDAGQVTEDALATAGHCAGTAWNVFKIRRAINPATSVKSGTLRTAAGKAIRS